MAASECVPFAKTGGLADVVGALPQALAALGHEVAVMLPRYQKTKLANPKVVISSLSVPVGSGLRFGTVLEGPTNGGVRMFFLEYPQFFDRPELYNDDKGDYPDNAERFAFFSRAVLETAKLVFPPDVLHCHDWQTALVPVLKKSVYLYDWALARVPVMLTVHNLGYQGLFPPATLSTIGLSADLFHWERMEFHGVLNYLKGGLVYADRITTVSRKYALEIQTPEYGFGLDGVVRHRRSALAGIVNGVDYAHWDPATDRLIAKNYSPENLAGKAECKRDLLKQFGLPEDLQRPLIGIVSRFAAQKGFDLIAQVAADLAKENVSLVALGTGEPEYESLFERLAHHFPKRIAVRIAYDNTLAHKIEAGADMFLMPSRYEPCGLNQIYSLKYGTVPIVRATGGLDDTIDAETGFKFERYDGADLLRTIHAALEAYRDKQRWQKMMLAGMSQDFSWANSARQYAELYAAMVT